MSGVGSTEPPRSGGAGSAGAGAGTRVPVKKTYKLFIGGAFPRSESGRTYEAQGQNVARASRKDVRDAVQAARGAQSKWARCDGVQPRPGALPHRGDDGGARPRVRAALLRQG